MTKENRCRKLTSDEIRNATLHQWPRQQKTSIIPYSFDLSIIPKRIKEEAFVEFAQESFDPLNVQSISWLHKVLHQWEKNCDHAVKFTYVEKINKEVFGGIVIANCDNLKDASGYWQQVLTPAGQFQFGLVCIPSQYYDASGALIPYNVRTISHEIGHAIGLAHLHDVESIRIFLQNTPQGMGCSVMPYITTIHSDTSLCKSLEPCMNTSYAVMPGDFDTQMCQAIYGEDSLFFHKPGKLQEMQNYAFTGASIGYVTGLRGAAEYLFMRMGDTRANAGLKVLTIYYAMVLLNSVYFSDTSGYSNLFEQAQQLMIPLGGELCHVALNYLLDYLRAHDRHTLSRTLEITSTSLMFLTLGHGVLTAAQESFHTSFNYGAAIVSGLFSYRFFNSIGEVLIDSVLGPPDSKNKRVVKEPKKGIIGSLWSFFATDTPDDGEEDQNQISNSRPNMSS
ncbi:Uncharacterised protein [Legionella wadsworthii]|uniref:Uncharacterized protein n=1 Tax=Legionella wadsworthii TaxID=28088 RepID=A0A378LQT7_9GAMM|nr:hypothetical protein [Legionella wadsworthii]STY29153.1 Uncharacterised protein [Legionella wadsworthii]